MSSKPGTNSLRGAVGTDKQYSIKQHNLVECESLMRSLDEEFNFFESANGEFIDPTQRLFWGKPNGQSIKR